MAPEVLVAVALLAIAAATVGVTAAITRQRALDRLRAALGNPADRDLEPAIRRQLDRTSEAEWQATQGAEDLAQLADLLGVGVVRVDDDLRVRLANHAAHVFLGRRPGTVVGLSAIEAFVDNRIESVVREARERGNATGELVLRDVAEPTMVVRARRSPAHGIWIVLEDVTELRRLQRVRAEFIDNLSHELRTPLTNVRLLTETLARQLEDVTVPPSVRDRVDKIDVESEHLVQLVNELLDLSKIEQGPATLHLDSVDLAAAAGASVERLRLFAERQGVELRADLPPDVASTRVRGDAGRLGQLVVNLLHNAVKFSPEGGTVVIRVRSGAETVTLSVEDQGLGIPRADLERVFERFYKVDKARVRGGGGTGLGLAIAKHIVDNHDGRIAVESVEGRGSTFTVTLPREPLG